MPHPATNERCEDIHSGLLIGSSSDSFGNNAAIPTEYASLAFGQIFSFHIIVANNRHACAMSKNPFGIGGLNNGLPVVM